MILSDIDKHIEDRLVKIKIDGKPIKVYPHGEYRLKGGSEYPCFALERHGVYQMMENARPWCELVTANSGTQTITVQANLGGGELTGPISYTVTPYPTPIDIHYQIDIYATDRDHADYMLHYIYEALPIGYQPKIDNRYLLIVPLDPVVLNELEHPLFRTSMRYRICDVYLDRIETRQATAITVIDTDIINTTSGMNYGEIRY
jgi:hypothetical protein